MRSIFILSFFIFIPSLSIAEMIIGGEAIYHVVKGDSIELIGAKLGVNRKNIIKANKINVEKPLQIGQKLRINTRKIVPKLTDDGIIINIPDMMLYFFKDGRLVDAFPVGLGMSSWRGMTRWRTPVEKFKVISKRRNPTWHVPESMQLKMKMEGKPVKTVVPPGPENPLGKYAIDTSIPRVVIHETIWPTTVYQFRSHGCIRVLPEDMKRFFSEVEINTSGETLYSPVEIAISKEGRVFLEVHKDIYGRVKDLNAEASRLLEKAGVMDKVDRIKMNIVIKEKSGIAEDITL